MKRHRKHWYIVPETIALRMAAKGFSIKPKPYARCSAHNGGWLVLAHLVDIHDARTEQQGEQNAR